MTDAELDKINENFRKTEEEGAKSIIKYFDRIHDKLFTFNNILIAGYFTLSKLLDSISAFTIIIPLINLGFLIYIEYRMMEKSRFEADIRSKDKSQIDNHGLSINKINFYSLKAIASTTLVTLYFLYNLLATSPKFDTETKSLNTNFGTVQVDTLKADTDTLKVDSITVGNTEKQLKDSIK